MVDFLERFLSGQIDTNQLRADFQQKTANEWDVFGLKGFSGARFLNMLVNNFPDQNEVSHQIRATLPMPRDVESGYQQLSNFMEYLKNQLQLGFVSKRSIQPAHAPFFVSAWWHVQNSENWPIYYISARKALASESTYIPLSDPGQDYFAFREVFLDLSETLELNAWDMEQLCVWREKRLVTGSLSVTLGPITITATGTTSRKDKIADSEAEQQDEAIGTQVQNEITHTQVQLLLAMIGKKLGCNIWVASNDRNKIWNSERLSDYSLSSLPPYIVADHQAQKTIGLIDVLWLKGNRGVAAAFEIEHSTSIFSGLLRVSDLVTLQPNISFPLYIVSSIYRIPEVRKQLSRPTFQYLELHKRCGFFAYEDLIKESENIMRWAQAPEAIDALAEYVPDIFES
jgi:hypothetical protein